MARTRQTGGKAHRKQQKTKTAGVKKPLQRYRPGTLVLRRMMKAKSETRRTAAMKTDRSFSNKRSIGIPSGSMCLKQQQQKFCNNNNKLKLLVIHGELTSLTFSIFSFEYYQSKITRTFPDPELLLTTTDELEFFYGEELALWNPSTMVFKTLPQPQRSLNDVVHKWRVGFFGLGLDPKTTAHDDYKVIRFLKFKGDYLVELYSLKNKTWKQIPYYPHAGDHTIPDLAQPMYINGFNYWIASTGTFNEDLAIVSFDFAIESFPPALITGPNKAYKIDDDRHLYLLAEFEGSLALVVCDELKKLLELWVWNKDNDESWRREGVWTLVDVVRPLAFLKNRLFYFEDSKRELVFFDCATPKLKTFLGLYAPGPLPFFMFTFC